MPTYISHSTLSESELHNPKGLTWDNGNLTMNASKTFKTDILEPVTGGGSISMTTATINVLGGPLDVNHQDITNVDINSGDISGITISGSLTWSAAQDLNSQSLTNINIDSGDISGVTLSASSITASSLITANGGIKDSSLTSGRVAFVDSDQTITDNSNFTYASDTLTVPKIGAFTATGAIDFGNVNMTNVNILSGTVNTGETLAVSDISSTGNIEAQSITSNSDVTVTGNLKVGTIQNTDGENAITIDANQKVSITSELDVPVLNLTGNELEFANSAKISNPESSLLQVSDNLKVKSGESSLSIGVNTIESSTDEISFSDNNLTTTGNISGNALTVSSITYNGDLLTPTGEQINKLATVTSSSSELNILTGVTADTNEINYLTGAQPGVTGSNTAVIYSSGGFISGTLETTNQSSIAEIGNGNLLTINADVDIASDDVSLNGVPILHNSGASFVELRGITSIDNTTKTSIEAGITNLSSLAYIQGQSLTLSGPLNVESGSVINQDLSTDSASVQFNKLQVGDLLFNHQANAVTNVNGSDQAFDIIGNVTIYGDFDVTGTQTNIDQTNLSITNKTILVNDNGAASSGSLAGIEVEENSSVTAYIKTTSDRNGWEFNTPNNSELITLAIGSNFGILSTNASSGIKIDDALNVTGSTTLPTTQISTLNVTTDATITSANDINLVTDTLNIGNSSSTNSSEINFLNSATSCQIKWINSQSHLYISQNIFLGTSTQKIKFRDNGIYINSSADGLLDIVSDTTIKNTATTLQFVGTTLDVDAATIDIATQATNFNLKDSTVGALTFESTLLTLDTSNTRVGIGTASPTYKLDVDSGTDDGVARFVSTDNKAVVQIGDIDTNGYISAENGHLSLGAYTGVNANNLNINVTSNKVGIGITNPTEKLHVDGNFILSGNALISGNRITFGNGEYIHNETNGTIVYGGDLKFTTGERTIDIMPFDTGSSNGYDINIVGHDGYGTYLIAPGESTDLARRDGGDINITAGLKTQGAGLASGGNDGVIKLNSKIEIASDIHLPNNGLISWGTNSANNWLRSTNSGHTTIKSSDTVRVESGTFVSDVGTHLIDANIKLDIDSPTVEISGTIDLAGDLDVEGDIDMATGKKITWVDDTQYIEGTNGSMTIDADNLLYVRADNVISLESPTVKASGTYFWATGESLLDGKITANNDLDIAGDIDMATGKKLTWVNDDSYISATDTIMTIDGDSTINLMGSMSVNLASNLIGFGTNTNADTQLSFFGDTNNGIIKWKEDEDRFEFSDDIWMTDTEKIYFRDDETAIYSSLAYRMDIIAKNSGSGKIFMGTDTLAIEAATAITSDQSITFNASKGIKQGSNSIILNDIIKYQAVSTHHYELGNVKIHNVWGSPRVYPLSIAVNSNGSHYTSGRADFKENYSLISFYADVSIPDTTP